MKKSELKEMIKSAMMAEGDNYYEDGMNEGDNGIVKRKIGGMSTKLKRFRNDAVKDYNNYKYYYKTPEGKWDDLTNLVWKKKVFNAYMSQEGFAYVDGIPSYMKDGMDEAKKVEVEDDENIDVDIEKNVKVDDESTESDIEVDTMMPGESETEQEIQGLLMKAQEVAAKLGDEKLTDQIGNTITYFTRAHISQVDEAEDYNSDVADISMDNPAEDAEIGFALQEVKRFQKLAGIITEGVLLKEEYKGTNLLDTLKDIQKKLTAESFNVAPLQKGNDWKKEITDKIGADGSKLAAILMVPGQTNAGGTNAKIVVNEMASSQLDSILKGMGLEDSKYKPGDKIATSLQGPESISISNRQKYPKGCYEVVLYQEAK